MGIVRSLANKMDELTALTRSQRVYQECSLLCFTELWLNQDIPDDNASVKGFHTLPADTDSSARASCERPDTPLPPVTFTYDQVLRQMRRLLDQTGRNVLVAPTDYRPVALTSHIMKTMERLILDQLCPMVRPHLDPLQFAYHASLVSWIVDYLTERPVLKTQLHCVKWAYFLRRLRSFNICRTMLRIFYESVVASAIACWGSTLRVADANRLNKLIRKASNVVGMELDPIKVVLERLSKFRTMLDNTSHPLHDVLDSHRSMF
nr:uncharacterized protein LOC111835896 isoform X1 [Paramormyrops kingsleyae]XP_023652429.1 uncharacterized protein LOC111835896 isoform X1 [Paramormyrops kingsleyae]